MTEANLLFLPWVRRGAAAGLVGPDRFESDQPGAARTTATLTVNGQQVAVPVTVMGPGSVTGLDHRQVIRTDPAPESHTFETNFFPMVELDEPALPWLFTPAAPSAQARLRPWLVLAVVRMQPGVHVDPPRLTPLPVLRVGPPASPAVELPDLADSWAWAHAQLVATDAEPDPAARLKAHPERSLARLLCSRVLSPHTAYRACLVPAFALGRQAGLGQESTPEDEARLEPAWRQSDTSVELPVYYSWEFSTGAGGDFASLAMLLKARPLPDGVGMLPMDVSASGLPVSLPRPTTVQLSGALRPVRSRPNGWPTPAMQAVWEAALALVLNAPAAVTATEDPLLAPPLYGSAEAGLDKVDPQRPRRWFEQLNLSPEHRVTAQLGTRVVQEQQEALMASAWAQTADLARVNQLLRQVELGCTVASSLHARHVERMDPGTGLQVLAPAYARILRTAVESEPDTGLAARLTETGLDPVAFSTGLRRLARPRGAVNRRVQRASTGPVQDTKRVLVNLQPTRLRARRLVLGSARVSLERVAGSLGRNDISWFEASSIAVRDLPNRPFFAFTPPGVPVPMGPSSGSESAAGAIFRLVARRHLARFNPPRTPDSPAPMPNGQLADAFTEAVARTTPAETYAARLRGLLTLPGPPRSGDWAFDRVGLSPVFNQPMVEPLAELAPDLLLPGLDRIPPNTAVPLESNAAFVRAYLVGLNTEMGRELVWRGFPADLAATYFSRFWSPGAAEGRPPDIDAIDTWQDRPLDHALPSDAFVLLIRSELLRRYPHAVVFATRAGPPKEDRQPVFAGGMEPDVRYFGFDLTSAEIREWSIVVAEHPSAPRFGVAVDAAGGTGSHRSPVGGNAAIVAQQARQLPVRITLPARVLLGAP